MNDLRFKEAEFWEFCSQLSISSKDEGLIKFDRPNGCQRYFIKRLVEGIADGRHIVVCLKGRQLGLSTIMLALDLYWIFINPDIEATVIVQDEKMREKFRTDILTFYESLPAFWRSKMDTDNRNQMVFLTGDGNRAKIIWQIASERSGTKLGRGTGITFMHGTEISSWGCGKDALGSLQKSFSEKNPNRLYVYESTAEGYNMFKDLWDTAKKSVTQNAVFVPWWLNEAYCVEPDTPANEAIFRTYFGRPLGDREPIQRRLNGEEIDLWKRVKQFYDYEPTQGQVAWMRMQIAEFFHEDLNLFLQELPLSEQDAFRVTGSAFFPNDRLTDMMEKAVEREYSTYRITFGEHFEDTQVAEAPDATANIRVWKPPLPIDKAQLAYYTLGCDPAYGSSEWADGFAISVLRVYADHAEQVCEFYTDQCTTTYFAWVMCYLAGWYGNSWLNLELNGPGQVVLQQLEDMKAKPQLVPTEQRKDYRSVLRNIHDFRFNRYNGGMGRSTLRHWKSTPELKWRMMSALRDSVFRGMLDVPSVETIEEMLDVVVDEGFIGGAGRDKDDRVIATGLAHATWVENLRPRLIRLGVTRKAAQDREQGVQNPLGASMITRLLKDRGLKGGAPKLKVRT